MNIICEMYIKDFFKLSSGDVAFVGTVVPDIEKYIFKCKADLYVDGQKIRTINLIGEDIFCGGDAQKRQGIRSVRTDDDIISNLSSKEGKEIKLLIYEN